jgi:hypothetical protein
MPRLRRKPSYTLHKPTGQARVRIGGRDDYLGFYGSKESREEYDRLIDEFFVKDGDVEPATISIRKLTVLFIRHADRFSVRDGEPTGEADNFRQAIRPLNALFRDARVRDSGPKRLMQVRTRMIEQLEALAEAQVRLGLLLRLRPRLAEPVAHSYPEPRRLSTARQGPWS